MPAFQTIAVQKEGAVLRVRLARPKTKNAFTPLMIAELRRALRAAEKEAGLRVIALTGEGGVFCSGGDLKWMRESLDYTRKQNLKDTRAVYELFAALDACPLPLVCGVEGYALGGGVGLVSVCDYAIARAGAQFSLAEVKVGLLPACIGPFVLRKIGESHSRALFLSGERFGAERALQIGLVHEVAEGEAYARRLEEVTASMASGSPQAVKTAKRFIGKLRRLAPGPQGKLAYTTLADIRVTPEAQEGLRAFLEKRPPAWRKA